MSKNHKATIKPYNGFDPSLRYERVIQAFSLGKLKFGMCEYQNNSCQCTAAVS